MPKQDRRSNRVPNKVIIPKRKHVTVNDLLARDDVNGILADLNEIKPYIKDAIVIYMDKRDSRYHWQITEDTLVSTATWMLESTKLDLLNLSEEGE